MKKLKEDQRLTYWPVVKNYSNLVTRLQPQVSVVKSGEKLSKPFSAHMVFPKEKLEQKKVTESLCEEFRKVRRIR